MKTENLNDNILPVITLYQPWATCIMRLWKTIETRTHNRFACLNGKKILIHAGQQTDVQALRDPKISRLLQVLNPDEMVNGYILGSAVVTDFRLLNTKDSFEALIECDTKRYGLFLQQINKWKNPVPEKGQMGIWYYDTFNMCRVAKKSI